MPIFRVIDFKKNVTAYFDYKEFQFSIFSISYLAALL